MNDEKEIYTPNKRREIIKDVLIVFLVILLVLTFFSNTIMNKSLAEISTEKAVSGKLTERIRGSGIVESNQSYEVKVNGNKVIDTIMIKSGQEIEKGDVLFTVGTEDSDAVAEAETALSALELEYQKALLTPEADYSAENQAINVARAELNSAIAKRDNFIANQGNIQAAKDNYNYNKNLLNSQTRLQTKLQSTITAIDSDEYSMAAAEYTGDILILKSNYETAESEYNSAYSAYMQMVSGGSYKPDNGNYEEYQEYEDYKETEPIQTFSDEEIANAKTLADEKEVIRNNAKAEYENAKYNLRTELVYQLSDVENQIDSLNNLISEYESSTDLTSTMTIDDLNDLVQTKQNTLEELIATLNKTKTSDENQTKINNLDIEAKKQEIEKQKQKIEKLKKENEITEITSKYSGVVSSINVKPGETTVPDMPIAVIDITADGYTVQITVDAQKSQKIKKGVSAEVVNNWSGDIEAVLTDIKNDTTSGSKNRILIFSVTGDVESGTNLDLSIPCGGGSYDVIVPKSAVYQDKDGYFVLTVNSKSSPLGNRYYAERVDVEVLVSDEVSSAVQGNINAGDYVITTASKPVSPKEQVRMQDT